jgi:hypothetical protein
MRLVDDELRITPHVAQSSMYAPCRRRTDHIRGTNMDELRLIGLERHSGFLQVSLCCCIKYEPFLKQRDVQ